MFCILAMFDYHIICTTLRLPQSHNLYYTEAASHNLYYVEAASVTLVARYVQCHGLKLALVEEGST